MDMKQSYFAEIQSCDSFGIVVGKASKGLVVLYFYDHSDLWDFLDLNPILRGSLITYPDKGAKLWFTAQGDYPCSGNILADGRDWARFHSTGEIVSIEVSNDKKQWSLDDADVDFPKAVKFSDIIWFSRLCLPWEALARFCEYSSGSSKANEETSWEFLYKNGSDTFDIIGDGDKEIMTLIKEDNRRYKYWMGQWESKLDSFVKRKIAALSLTEPNDIITLVITPLIQEYNLSSSYLNAWIELYCPKVQTNKEELDV